MRVTEGGLRLAAGAALLASSLARAPRTRRGHADATSNPPVSARIEIVRAR